MAKTIDMTTGSLGLGFSAACGMALSGKVYNAPYRVYAVLGDGESEEGQVWEAAMFASHYKLDNLVRPTKQADGTWGNGYATYVCKLNCYFVLFQFIAHIIPSNIEYVKIAT